MEVTIYNVRQQDVDVFKELDPIDRLILLDLPGGFALAAFTPGEDGIEVPSGLLVGIMDEQYMCISWIAVMPDVQGLGIGEKLILAAYDMADSVDIPRIDVLVSSEYDVQKISDVYMDFFRDRLFEKESPLPPEFIGLLGELQRLEFFKQDIKKLPKPTRLSSLSQDRINDCLAQLMEMKQAHKLCPIMDDRANIDTDISFVFVDGKEVFGALIVQKLEGCLIPICFYGESDRESAALAICSTMVAEKKYGKSIGVQIITRSDALSKFFNKLYSDKKAFGKVLTANLQEYRSLKQEQQEEVSDNYENIELN